MPTRREVIQTSDGPILYISKTGLAASLPSQISTTIPYAIVQVVVSIVSHNFWLGVFANAM